MCLGRYLQKTLHWGSQGGYLLRVLAGPPSLSSHLPHTVTNNNLFSNKKSSLTVLDAPLIAIKLIWVGQDKTKAILNTYYKKKRNTITSRKKHWKFSLQLYVISVKVKYRYWNLLCFLWYISWCAFLFLVSESFCWSIDLEWAWVKFALFLANTFFSLLLHTITTSAPRLLIIQEDTFFLLPKPNADLIFPKM